MKKLFLSLVASLLLLTSCATSDEVQIITLKAAADSKTDMTEQLRSAIEGATSKNIKIVLEDATYFFTPEYAYQKYIPVTNHGNGMKNIIFYFDGFESVEIVGNGAKLLFHGLIMPFHFDNCNKVAVTNLSVDWDIPFLFQGDVTAVNDKEGWFEIKPYTKGYSWKLVGNEIKFPNIDGFNYFSLGSTLTFEKGVARVTFGALDCHLHPTKIEKKADGVLRLYEKMRQFPKVGDVLNCKGNREHDRYSPAFETLRSSNILFVDVTVHHALGMGYLFEKSSDIILRKCRVVLPPNSDRVVSSTADATHFANCKGKILIEDCTFENMLDDGTNVHGTYMNVDKVLSENSVRVNFKHFEQLGFEFAQAGDDMWFIIAPSPERAAEAKVASVKAVNDKYLDITFETPLPEGLKEGDVLENKTWNPEFTMRGCTIQNHRARNIILKTPLKTVIKNNRLSSMMSSILFRGETFNWYESGAVCDVLIKNNYFEYFAYSGAAPHAALCITPKLGNHFDTTTAYDKNIRFEDNTLVNFTSTIVWADRAEGLKISGNKIEFKDDMVSIRPNVPLFELIECKDVEISNNSFVGKTPQVVKADKTSSATLKMSNNKGF